MAGFSAPTARERHECSARYCVLGSYYLAAATTPDAPWTAPLSGGDEPRTSGPDYRAMLAEGENVGPPAGRGSQRWVSSVMTQTPFDGLCLSDDGIIDKARTGTTPDFARRLLAINVWPAGVEYIANLPQFASRGWRPNR